MFSSADYDKLQQIMEESPEKHELLTRLLDSQQMMLSSISHEIRNPLTLIYSALQLIAKQHPEVSGFRHWKQLVDDVEYIRFLLEELSSYNNSSKLNLSATDSDAFFKMTALSFAAAVTDTDIEFVSKIAPNLPAIHCDRIKLRQVLLNLLGNAKDAVLSIYSLHPEAVHPETVSRRISLEALPFPSDSKALPAGVTIKISDNGCGIAPEHLDHIFEPFVTYKSNGTGLGLAIAHRIVLAHGGSLTVSSDPGILTTFTITLPIQQNGEQKS